MTKDSLERIANALDGGGDYHQGKPDEVGYLERIANALENGGTKKEYIFDKVDFNTETVDSLNAYYIGTEDEFEQIVSNVPYTIEYDDKTFTINSINDLEYLVNGDSNPNTWEEIFSYSPFGFYLKTGTRVDTYLVCSTSGKHSFGIYKSESSGGSSDFFYNIIVGEHAEFDGYTFDDVYVRLYQHKPVIFHFDGIPAAYSYFVEADTKLGTPAKIVVGRVKNSSDDGRYLAELYVDEYTFYQDGNYGTRSGKITLESGK